MSKYALPIAALGFAVWAVYLGGLASLQSTCDTQDLSSFAVPNGLPCSKTYRLYWFYMSWEIVIIAALGAVAASGKLASMRASFVGLFAVGTLLFIDASNTFLTAQSMPIWDDSNPEKHRLRTTVAGSIMVAVVNAAAVLLLGIEDEVPQATEEKAAV